MASLSKSYSNAGTIYPAKEAHFSYHPSRRSVVHSTKGIVACTQPLAAQCGIKILQAGGNCADAAVAVAAGMNVTEPSQTGIGGDMFCLFYDASTKKVHALNGSGRSAVESNVDTIKKELNIKVDSEDPSVQHASIPRESVHAITVPGAAAGWTETVRRFGSGKVSMKDILAPAIELAQNGFPVSEISARMWQDNEARLKRVSPKSCKDVLKDDAEAVAGCRAPHAGEIVRNTALANTLRLLADEGVAGFYAGPVGEAIVDAVKERGGNLNLDDLESHVARCDEEVKPISIIFNGQGVGAAGGIQLWEHPPNGQGVVALMALGMLEHLEKELQGARKIKRWTHADHNSVEYLHILIEVLKIAFADRDRFVADPQRNSVPTEALISEKYLAERAKLFDPDRAANHVEYGFPSSDTVYLAVTDASGNGISFINSLSGSFGSCIVPEGCGFALQNRGVNFSLEEGHPNFYEPGKRPFHTIIPAMLTNPSDGSLNTVYGIMGGFMQPQGHVQVLLNMLVFGMNPQAALDAPRICIGPGAADSGADKGSRKQKNVVHFEEGFDEGVISELERKGHVVKLVKGFDRSLFGRGQVIRLHEEGGLLVHSAGSDQRGDGGACPNL